MTVPTQAAKAQSPAPDKIWSSEVLPAVAALAAAIPRADRTEVDSTVAALRDLLRKDVNSGILQQIKSAVYGVRASEPETLKKLCDLLALNNAQRSGSLVAGFSAVKELDRQTKVPFILALTEVLKLVEVLENYRKALPPASSTPAAVASLPSAKYLLTGYEKQLAEGTVFKGWMYGTGTTAAGLLALYAQTAEKYKTANLSTQVLGRVVVGLFESQDPHGAVKEARAALQLHRQRSGNPSNQGSAADDLALKLAPNDDALRKDVVKELGQPSATAQQDIYKQLDTLLGAMQFPSLVTSPISRQHWGVTAAKLIRIANRGDFTATAATTPPT